MLSRASKGVAGLLSRPLSPSCRKCLLPSTLRMRDVFVRLQHADGESQNHSPESESQQKPQDPQDSQDPQASQASQDTPHPHDPRYRLRLRDPLDEKRYSRVPISIPSLGEPAEVVVVPHPERRVRNIVPSNNDPEHSKDDTDENTKYKLPLMLHEVTHDDLPDNTVIKERIESFRASRQPQDKLAVTDWENLRRNIQLSFSASQLSDYVEGYEEDTVVSGEGQIRDGEANTADWRPGISSFLETEPVPSERVTKRITAAQERKGKYLLAERILRECWQLGIVDEVGQLDVRLPTSSISLFVHSENFSFEELAGLHGSKIDVTHSLGLIRITGPQHSCESIREIIYDATTRIREENLELYPPGTSFKGKSRVFTADFLSWIVKTYGVIFDQSQNTPSKMFYLVENKPNADSARRALNLAIHNASQPSIPFGTYMPASEAVDIYSINPELNVAWFDRKKPWFRWAVPSAQTTESSSSETPFFNKHETRLSDQLLKLLRTTSRTQIGNAEAHESITAAVGRCLFLHKPFEDKTISATQLGKMSLPRTFVADIPRVMPFMQQLAPNLLEENVQPHRIRLVPSAIHANIFPQLEVDVGVAPGGFETEFDVRSAKAILSESSVDYLLPESGLDLRFTRKLTHDLLESFGEDGPLAYLQASLRDFFSKAMIYEGETSLPAFSQLSIPNHLLVETGEARDPDSYTSAEYMYLPVSDVRGTCVHQYDFEGHRLNHSFYESGPFNPFRVTDVFLDMDVTEKLGQSPSNKHGSQEVVEQQFKSFYSAACSLAFSLDRAGRAI